ncbi:hypothetical protein VP01_237g5 [Puccinia sorghi]|uniref:Uncharacterized protein n=1 Tax=Puccinia sorghi TaxID=27349 RepID=A0A0L6V6Z6_9BASI|nr:hypothetical protein VP01_237g5 [Puccinia sorghi]
MQIHQYIDKILDVEVHGHFVFWVIGWALRCGQEAFMDASSKKIDTVAQRIHDELGPCDIDHWMSMPTMGHLMGVTDGGYNSPVYYYGKEA